MELWLDTTDIKAIDEAVHLGILHGVTTNPSLVSKAQIPLEDLLDDLLNRLTGPIAVQVVGQTLSEMIEQAKDLNDYSQRIIVKIPATAEGIKAIHHLNHIGIATMATAVIEPLQGMYAAKAGARYLAPYFSKMGEKPLETLVALHNIIEQSRLSTKILAASLKTLNQVIQCCERGISVTINEQLFHDSLETPEAAHAQLIKFEEEWNRAAESKLLLKKSSV